MVLGTQERCIDDHDSHSQLHTMGGGFSDSAAPILLFPLFSTGRKTLFSANPLATTTTTAEEALFLTVLPVAAMYVCEILLPPAVKNVEECLDTT